MLIKQRIAVFTAALIYTFTTFMIVATSVEMTELAAIVIGLGNPHL